ncbi:hypothetical protein GCM10010399_88640 [Dactylosporangium fulvum]
MTCGMLESPENPARAHSGSGPVSTGEPQLVRAGPGAACADKADGEGGADGEGEPSAVQPARRTTTAETISGILTR